MDWKTLFFSFDGRIGRRTWWLASIVLISSATVLTALVNPRIWIGSPPNIAETLLSLAMIIPQTAVSVKRFNDRDWPHWLPYGFAMIAVVTTLLLHFRLILDATPPTVGDAAIVASMVVLIAFVVIDNGLLRGTIGPNRHGPDPLPTDASPAVPAEEKKPHAA